MARVGVAPKAHRVRQGHRQLTPKGPPRPSEDERAGLYR